MNDAEQKAVKDKLARSFSSYAEEAKKIPTRPDCDLDVAKSKLKTAHTAPRVVLKAGVNALEHSQLFKTLLSDCGKCVSINYPSSGSAAVDEIFDKIRIPLLESFRRYRFYPDTFYRNNINSQDYFDLLLTRIQKRYVKIISLWTRGASFPHQQVDFGPSQIGKYRSKELDGLLANDINQVFYPTTLINTNETRKRFITARKIPRES